MADFLNLPREILCIEFFGAPIDSPALYVKGQNESPLYCHLSLDERYERKGNLRRYERHSWGRPYYPLNCHEVSQGKSFSKSTLDTDFEPKIEEEDIIDKTILGVLEEHHFPHSARLPKEYSFQ
jgi:hypothetical protein